MTDSRYRYRKQWGKLEFRMDMERAWNRGRSTPLASKLDRARCMTRNMRGIPIRWLLDLNK